jgi:hypothetical protein
MNATAQKMDAIKVIFLGETREANAINFLLKRLFDRG